MFRRCHLDDGEVTLQCSAACVWSGPVACRVEWGLIAACCGWRAAEVWNGESQRSRASRCRNEAEGSLYGLASFACHNHLSPPKRILQSLRLVVGGLDGLRESAGVPSARTNGSPGRAVPDVLRFPFWANLWTMRTVALGVAFIRGQLLMCRVHYNVFMPLSQYWPMLRACWAPDLKCPRY
jgi:hypothetical protein